MFLVIPLKTKNIFLFCTYSIALGALYILVLILKVWLLLDYTLTEVGISIQLEMSTMAHVDKQVFNKKEEEKEGAL